MCGVVVIRKDHPFDVRDMRVEVEGWYNQECKGGYPRYIMLGLPDGLLNGVVEVRRRCMKGEPWCEVIMKLPQRRDFGFVRVQKDMCATHGSHYMIKLSSVTERGEENRYEIEYQDSDAWYDARELLKLQPWCVRRYCYDV